jgi:hypothetical protein
MGSSFSRVESVQIACISPLSAAFIAAVWCLAFFSAAFRLRVSLAALATALRLLASVSLLRFLVAAAFFPAATCFLFKAFMATEHITFVAGNQVLREFGVKGNATFCNPLECVVLWGTDLTK